MNSLSLLELRHLSTPAGGHQTSAPCSWALGLRLGLTLSAPPDSDLDPHGTIVGYSGSSSRSTEFEKKYL